MILGKIVSSAGILWQKKKEKQLLFGLFSVQFSEASPKEYLRTQGTEQRTLSVKQH